MSTLGLLLVLLRVLVLGITAQQDDVPQFHPPPYANTYSLTVNQNYVIGSTVYDAHCIGNSSNPHEIVYGLNSSEHYFVINSTSGVISLNISARDLPGGGPFTSIVYCGYVDAPRDTTVQLSVRYRLENQHVPAFTHSGPIVDVWVREDHVQTAVMQLNVTDEDLDPCDIVTFEILSGNVGDTFTLDPQTGVLVLNGELDYETNAKYNLSIRATNTQCGDRRYAAQTMVCIYVLDIDDEHPTFQQHVYNFSLSEKQRPLTFAQLECTDADSTGDQILYDEGFTTSSENPFEINFQTGHISATQELDFERGESYRLTFQCYSLQSPNIRDTAVVLINVIPVNEHLPELSVLPLYLPFNYSSPVGTLLASARNNSGAPIKITATDSDRGLDHGRIRFNLSVQDENNFNSYFHINTVTGDLTLSRSLDFDVCSSRGLAVVLRIVACDGPHENSMDTCPTATITLWISDSCTLTFLEENHSISVSESTVIGSELLQVHCRVRGKGSSQTRTIETISQNSTFANTLRINRNGTVFLNETLDYELVDQFNVILHCTDDSQETNATLTIHVLPENDNPPYFEKSLHYFNISLDRSATNGLTGGLPVTVGSVSAIDNDKGIGSDLTYELTDNKDVDSIQGVSEYFMPEPATNQSVSIILHHLPRDDVVMFDIIVRDGIGSDRSTVIVYINPHPTTQIDSVTQGADNCGTTCFILIAVLVLFMLTTAVVIVVVCMRFLYINKRKQLDRPVMDGNNLMMELRDKSNMMGYSTIEARNFGLQDGACSQQYPRPMVAACPVYAQTNKADGHAENEHYASAESADYHYVSNRGIKLPRRTSSANRARQQRTESLNEEMDDYIKMELSPEPQAGRPHSFNETREKEGGELALPSSLGIAGSFKSLEGAALPAVENIYERIQ